MEVAAALRCPMRLAKALLVQGEEVWSDHPGGGDEGEVPE